MEELLNKLIEKGWKPRGKNYGVIDFLGTLVFVDLNDGRLQSKNALNLRKLISKDSGLWQFVCEKELIFIPEGEIPHVERNYIFDYECYDVSEFQYWLMVGALLKEDEIEQFLLDNIKIDE